MLSINEIRKNPVEVQVANGDSRYVLVIKRLKGGKVQLSCSCPHFSFEGWCQHSVELLCFRYDRAIFATASEHFDFEDLVLGTQLQDAAEELVAVREDFDKAVIEFEKCKTLENGIDQLDNMGVYAHLLGDAAAELASALATLKSRLKRIDSGVK